MPTARLLKTPQQNLTPFSNICPRNTKNTSASLNRLRNYASPGTLLGSWGRKLPQADRQFFSASHSLPNCNVAKCDLKGESAAKIAHSIHCQVTPSQVASDDLIDNLTNIFARKEKFSQVKNSFEKKRETTSVHFIFKGETDQRGESEDSPKPAAEVKSRLQPKIVFKILLSFKPKNLCRSEELHCHCCQVCQPTAALQHLLPAKCQQLPLPAKTLASFQPVHTHSGEECAKSAHGPHHVSNTDCLTAGLHISCNKCQRVLPVPCISSATASYIS